MTGENMDNRLKKIREILMDRVRGSREIILDILRTLEDSDKATVEKALEYSLELQPSMAVLSNILSRIINVGEEPRKIIDKLNRIDHEIAENLISILDEKPHRIATFSRSGTLYNVFSILNEKGYVSEIIVSEARPVMEGISFAEELRRRGIRVTLVIDILLPIIIRDVDIVVVGCDAILPNHDVVNKTGSHTLAICSRYFGKPFIVCGDEYKVLGSYDYEIRYGPRNDVYNGDMDINVINPYFEKVPHELIDYIVLNNEVIKRRVA